MYLMCARFCPVGIDPSTVLSWCRWAQLQGLHSPPSLLWFDALRSFEPILRLLPQGISPVSQHWATWALYNLVSVYRKHLQAF